MYLNISFECANIHILSVQIYIFFLKWWSAEAEDVGDPAESVLILPALRGCRGKCLP